MLMGIYHELKSTDRPSCCKRSAGSQPPTLTKAIVDDLSIMERSMTNYEASQRGMSAVRRVTADISVVS
jgi:hypothetical protein